VNKGGQNRDLGDMAKTYYGVSNFPLRFGRRFGPGMAVVSGTIRFFYYAFPPRHSTQEMMADFCIPHCNVTQRYNSAIRSLVYRPADLTVEAVNYAGRLSLLSAFWGAKGRQLSTATRYQHYSFRSIVYKRDEF